MKNIFKNKRILILSIFIISILSISLGYAYLKSKLSINGNTGIASNSWIIYFDNIVEKEDNIEAVNVATIDENKTKVSFDVNLKEAQDTYEFNVDIVNDGSLDAQIDKIIKTSLTLEQSKNLDYEITYEDGTKIKPCDTLPANSKRNIVVKVRLREGEKYLVVDSDTLNLSFEIDYIQYDENKECDLDEDTYTLTIDPKGGEYNGSTNSVIVEGLVENQKVVLKDNPIKEDYYFKGWITRNDDDYITDYEEGIKTVTIRNKNAYLEADYRLAVGPYTLYIDPNGGTYEGSTEIITKDSLPTGRVIRLGADPVKDGVLFRGWTAITNDAYTTEYNGSNNSAVIRDKDAYLKAEYGDPVALIVETDTYYGSLQMAFNAAEPGQNIRLLVDTEENPINYKKTSRGTNTETVTLDLNGKKVTGKLINNDILTIKNGTIENLSGIACINNGTLTMGIDDGTVLVDEEGTIALIGMNTNGGVGLEQNGIFNFYDGYLEGYIGLDGIFDDIPNNHYAFVDHNNEKDCQKVYIIERPDRAIAKSVQNGMTLFFFKLQDALNYSMVTGNTIYAIRDFEGAYSLNVPNDETAIFDINGYTVKIGGSVTNNGTFTIKDSGKENDSSTKGELKTSEAITNNGVLNVQNIMITQTTDANVLENTGNINITASTITGLGGYAIDITDGESLVMDSDTVIKANGYAIHLKNSEPFTITGGIIYGIVNEGNLIIEDGTYITRAINSTVCVLNNSVSGKVYFTMNGGTIENIVSSGEAYGIRNDARGTYELLINNGTINIESTGNSWKMIGIDSLWSGDLNNIKITIKNIDFNMKGGADSNAQIFGFVRGNITIDDGTFNVTSTTGKAYFVNFAHLTINDGDFNITGNEAYFDYGDYARDTYATVEDGTINVIGTSNAVIFETYPITTINGGTLKSSHTCLQLGWKGKTLNDGTLECGTYGVESVYHYNGYGDTFTMNGGQIKSKSYGVYFPSLRYSFGLSMTGGKIISEESYGIYNVGENTININTKDAITNPSDYSYIEGGVSGFYLTAGTTKIEKAKIVGKTEYGIYSKGTLELGVDDDNVNQEWPLVIGDTIGLFVDGGNSNFYDGILKGQASGYSGDISGLAEACEIVEGSDVIDEVNYVTHYLQEQDNFLRVGDNEYNSFKRAINAIESEGTIEVLKNYDLKSDVEFPLDKTITLEFLGNTVTTQKTFLNNGNLTLQNTTELETGGIIKNGSIIIQNNKSLRIISGTYKSSGLIGIYNHGTTSYTMDGGTVETSNSGTVYVIHNDDSGNKTITLNGGKINGHVTNDGWTYAVGVYTSSGNTYSTVNNIEMNITSNTANYNRSDLGAVAFVSSDVTIYDGKFNIDGNMGYSSIQTGVKALTINGGEFTVNGGYAHLFIVRGGWTNPVGYLNVNGGTVNITGNYEARINSADAQTSITGGTIQSNIDCFYGTTYYSRYESMSGGTLICGRYGASMEGGTLNMSGGTITSQNIGINMSNRATFNMTGGKVISEDNNAIYSNGANVNVLIGASNEAIDTADYPYVEGATIGIYDEASSKVNVDKATVIGKNGYGIYTKNTLSIGTNDSTVSQEWPIVMGNDTGVKIESGTTNFYDGILKGTQNGYDGFISGFPDAYTIKDGTEVIEEITYKTNYLQEQDNFLRVGETEYNSLQRAIDTIESTGTIYVIANHESKSEATIPSSKNITIDFDNKTLMLYKPIINNGTLTLQDTSDNQTGGIYSKVADVLQNNSVLTINNGNYNTSEYTIIKNTGTNVTIKNGYFSQLDKGGFLITNNLPSSKQTNILIQNGTFEVKGSGNIGVMHSGEVSGSKVNVTIENSTMNIENIGTNGDITAAFYAGATSMEAEILNSTMNMKSAATSSNWNWSGIRAFRGQNPNAYKVTIYDGIYDLDCPTDYAILFTYSNGIIKGGTFTLNGKYAYVGQQSSIVTIDDGTIDLTGTGDAKLFHDSNVATINGGTVSSNMNCLEVRTTTTMNNGILNCKNHGVYLYNNSFTMNGGTINSRLNGVHMTGATLNMTGGSIISSEGYGIYSTGGTININPSDTNITNEEYPYVEGMNGGLYEKNGTLTLGSEDGAAHKDYLTLKGGEYGLYVDSGTVNVFDGTFIGSTYGYNVEAIFNKIETATSFYEETKTIEGEDWIYNYLKPEENFVINLDTNTPYNNLQTAISEALENERLQLTQDAQIYYEITIPDTTKASLDFNGYEIKTTSRMVNNGTLNIINGTNTTSKLYTKISDLNMIVNNGTLSIDKITINNETNSDKYLVSITNGAVTTINHSTFNSKNNIYVASGGSLDISNSTLTATSIAVNNEGTLNVDACNITGNDYGIYSFTSSNVEYKNSTISSPKAALYKYNRSSTETVTNNNFSQGYIYSEAGTMNITGGNINSYIRNKATMSINETEVNDTYNSWGGSYTSIDNTSTLNITNALYKMDRYGYGDVTMINNTGELNIIGGTYNLDNHENRNYVTIGINNGGTVNMSSSTISLYNTDSNYDYKDNYYGIKNNGTAILTMDGDTINISKGLTSYGIYVDKGIANIEAGTIDVEGVTSYGVYTNDTSSIVNIGVEDGSGTAQASVSTTNPFIKGIGSTLGIGVKRANGKINYYDGKLAGSTNAKPDITNLTEDNYEVSLYYDDINGYEYCVLEYIYGSANPNNMAAKMNGIYYRTINAAISKATDGDVIKLQRNVSEEIVNDNSNSITIDLNNDYTIAGTITNNGTLTLINGELTTTGTEYTTAITNNGTLTIGADDGTIIDRNVLVLGSSMGLQNNGTTYMYDGYIRGTTPVNGNEIITNDNYQIINEQIEGFDTVHVVVNE